MNDYRALEGQVNHLTARIAVALGPAPEGPLAEIEREEKLARLYREQFITLSSMLREAGRLELGEQLVANLKRQREYALNHAEYHRGSALAWRNLEAEFEGIAAS